MTTRTIFVVLAVAGTLGCGVGGSGIALHESRTLAPFERVEVAAGLEVEVGIGEPMVQLEGDDNLVPLILTRVTGATLRIAPEQDLNPVVPLRIAVFAPALRAAGAESGSALTVTVGASAELELRADAGSTLTAFGSAERLETELFAGGMLDATELPASVVTLHAAAGGELRVTATEAVTGLVESGSEAWVFGDPARRAVESASGGAVYYE